MSTTTNEGQTVYTSSDLATLLKVQESTIRKYSNMLEKAGLTFYRNEYGHKGYFDKDIVAFKRLIKLKKKPDMTLEKACNVIVATMKEHFVIDDTDDIDDMMSHGSTISKEDFLAFKDQQEQFNKQLIELLQKQQEYIETSLNKRDQVLMSTLRESLETQKQLAASQEKKSWWRRLFS